MAFQHAFRHRALQWYHYHRDWFGYLAIFAIAFLLFAYLQYTPIFADPDSFYHAKVAVLLRDGVFQRTFDALPYTTLATSYADQHFLYHVLLVPFVTIIDPLVGLKLATILFGSLLALTFYALLRQWSIRWAFTTTIVLLLVNPFMFRMNLAKASSVSLAILFLGIWAAFSHRPWILGILAAAYVWLHGGFALLAVAVVTFALVSVVHRRLHRRLDPNIFLHRIRALLGRIFRHHRVRRLNLRLVVAVVVGTALGITINPYFSENLRFYYDQLIRIGAVNYQKAIGVGGEWYPYGFIELVSNTVLVSIPLVIALVLFFLFMRRQSTRSITLFFLWLFFLLLTLKSRRYVEYYVPFALLFVAFSLHDTLVEMRWRQLWSSFRKTYLRKWLGFIGVTAFITYVAVILPTVVIRDFVTAKKDLGSGFRFGLFEQESQWIQEHGRPGSIVFHSDWDIFPVLFYYNGESRYIAGLDPTFLYLADPTRYRQWADVTLGKETGDVYEIVRGSFDSDFVLVENDHGAMDDLIRADDRFVLEFSGPDAKVYRVD